MKTIVTILLVILGYSGVAQKRYHTPKVDCTSQQRYNDSLFVYNVYATQIETLLNLKETDLDAWYTRKAHDDVLTSCARIRLKACNGKDYLPDADTAREQGGEALHFPAPSHAEHKAYFTDSKLVFRFSIVDEQVHLMYDSGGIRRIPFIVRYYYDQGKIILQEQLNPITGDTIPQNIKRPH